MDVTHQWNLIFRSSDRANDVRKAGLKLARVSVNPKLHLSESTAHMKADRFLERLGEEIDTRNALCMVLLKQIEAKYRKPLSRFRALYKDPRVADLLMIVRDAPKNITGWRLVHLQTARKRAYFCFSFIKVTNKNTRVMLNGGPMDIAISGHTLARMLERCSTSMMLDLKQMKALLLRLLLSASEADYDERGQARIGLDEFPGMMFVCRRNFELRTDKGLPAIYTVVTYFEK
jgi:hypothetical protein